MANYESDSDNENDKFMTSNEEEDDDIQNPINTRSDKFKEYKRYLLGNKAPVDGDAICESYKLEDVVKIKQFVLNIKEYNLNDPLDENHIKTFIDTLFNDKEIYFLDRVSLAQYNNYISTKEQSLIEIINGHHRIEALKRFYARVRSLDLANYKICLRLDIYHLDNPNSDKTMKLFRNFNAVRPQNTFWPAKTLTNKIIGLLNEKFSTRQFTFIKDNGTWTKKPSILMKDFATKMEKYLIDQLKTVKSITERNIDKVDFDAVIDKFIVYNDLLTKKSLEWFNDIKNRDSIDNNNVITHQIFDKAKKAKCFLGFVKLDHLITHCIFIKLLT
jgi:hypothetical protein